MGPGLKLHKYLILLSFFLPLACNSSRSPSSIEFGKTSSTELVQKLGEPEKKLSPEQKPSNTLFVYPADSHYQIEAGKVTAHIRTPESGEKELIYWKHRWRGLEQKESVVKTAPLPHGHALHQLSVLSSGESIIFEPWSGQVIRVLEHAKH